MFVLKRALPLGGIVFAILSGCMAADKNGPGSGELIPTIALSTAEVEFTASVDGKDPSAKTISVSGLSGYTPTAVGLGNITYGGGQVGDWLQASISGSPAIVTLHPTVLGLSVGVYEAFVPVLDPGATNSPQVVHVVFEVSGKSSISLSASQVGFGAAPGTSPQPQSVAVSSVGGPAELSNLAIVNVTYAAGEPQGWLSASLSSTSTPSVLNLIPSAASLPVGTYTASVGISDSAALNSPRNLAVTLEISNNPILGIAPNTMVFSAVEGGASPVAQTVMLSNVGPGALSGLAVGQPEYGLGASDWLTVVLGGNSAPTSAALQATTTGLPAGQYTASVPFIPSDTTIAPKAVNVTLNLAPAAALEFSASPVNFSAVVGSAVPGQSVVVSNVGDGAITGLSVGQVAYGAGANGWLSATLNKTSTPATLSLTVNASGVSNGTHTATVPVVSAMPGVPTRSLSVVLAVSSVAPGSIVLLSGDGQTGFTGDLLPNPVVARVYGTDGQFLPGAPITWTPLQGGTVQGGALTTNAQGQASAQWVLGTAAGQQGLQVQTPGVPSKTFYATAVVRPDSGYPNEPAGLTTITDRPFDAKVENGWTDRGDYRFSIVSDNTAPRSKPNIGRALFPLGFQGGRGPISTSIKLTGSPSKIYMSFWIRFSPNWDGHTSYVNKIFHIWINGGNLVYLSSQGVNAGPMEPQVRLQGVNESPVSRNLYPLLDRRVKITRGVWHRWELVLQVNTQGNKDGRADWWVDGVHVGSYSDISYVPASGQHSWSQVSWNPTWGGIADVVPADQTMDIDHVYISGN